MGGFPASGKSFARVEEPFVDWPLLAAPRSGR
jgi:hypothetical protein